MSSDGNPPSSWYDPPEAEYEYEIKEEKPADAGDKCERDNCYEDAAVQVKVGDVRYGGEWRVVCKGHYESAVDDAIDDAKNYEPDYDEED